MSSTAPADLVFPWPEPPEPGTLTEVAPGVLWLRLALPFALNHVNVYLLADGDGWAALDTGLGDEVTRAVWESVFAGRLHGKRLTRIIATHFHPDHIGQLGWLAEKFDAELLMSRTEYLFAMMLRGNLEAIGSPAHLSFFARHGLDAEATDAVAGRGHRYLHMTTGMPTTFQRLAAGDSIDIGGRKLEVFTGGGHAPEQVMLLCRDENLFFPADQVLARISPNVSVWGWEPAADPLGDYLESLKALRAEIPGDVLVLAAHNLPFGGAHPRLEGLIEHHAERCARIAAACVEPRSAAEIVPVLFRRALDAHQTGFAFGEVMAHINYMLRRGELIQAEASGGVERVRTA
jgi:glyoxylase-like metal-dependent hydrolase (beta-lactamase superfamily II)